MCCLVQDLKTKQVLALGKQIRKLYVLESHSFLSVSKKLDSVSGVKTSVETSFSSSDLESYSVWHNRLGHSSSDVLHHIPVIKMHNHKDYTCSVCPLAKQTRLPFSSSEKHTEKVFDLLHIDIWGPYRQPTLSGQNAYKLYDIHNQTLIVSRDVVFHESVFSYASSATTPNPSDSSPLPLPLSDFPPSIDSTLTDSTPISDHSPSDSMHFPVPGQRVSGVGAGYATRLNALEQNETWAIVDLPKGNKAIGSKWVYKVKLNSDGSVERYKARLVAKGYNQVAGIDYYDRFSPVAKAVTVRLILALASVSNWALHQININNAFLHGYLDEDIYLSAPDGYPVPAGKSANDHCLFIKETEAGLLILLAYVDDLLITSPSEILIPEVKQFLDAAFTNKDLGHARYFLGLEIARSSDGISITQHKYIREIIKDAGLIHSRPKCTPLPLGLKLTSQGHTVLADPEPFQSSLVSWKTKKQSTVSRSTAEAEYRSMGTTVCELQWISYLLQDIRVSIPTPISLFCDNQAALHIAANPVLHERTKHLEIDCHLVREKLKSGFILPSHISGKLQLADLFTKMLHGPTFASFLSKLGLVPFTQIQLEGGLINSSHFAAASLHSVSIEENNVEAGSCISLVHM
ncbi:UNVERIFIED_CONTAM: Retrovirus-related Pol polyprotein from transposon RE1 [Sesamum angustifolium]|uniref:Retrovirus-related Pol polyprotein from transposon RE1 n=1 Tax=Sesamum angustifolium TaxID=2727405 RepID=A0AAW2L819_9LAMI